MEIFCCVFIKGDSEMYSYDSAIHSFFGEVLLMKYNELVWSTVAILLYSTETTPLSPPPSSSSIVYDTVDFCITHVEHLCNKTNLFTRYFPNLLKVHYTCTCTCVIHVIRVFVCLSVDYCLVSNDICRGLSPTSSLLYQ